MTSSSSNYHCFELVTAAEIATIPASLTSSLPKTSMSSSTFYHGQKQNPRDPTIRHAGRVHIRGKIRRIWRPRYLELCDTGLVKYYELPATADVTMPEDSDWQHINMVIKDTLIIYNARIIDVTTLRDLHVGLPRGSYGFLFRGQRLYVNELLSKKNQEPDSPREYFCAVSTLEEAQTWVIALQWAAAMCKKNRIAETYYHDDSDYRSSGESLTEGSDDNVKGTSVSGVLQCGLKATPQSPTVSTTSALEPIQESSKHKSGKILVTKAYGFRVIRIDSDENSFAFRWEIAYEIALLMVKSTSVEERRILLTAQELEELLESLEKGNKNQILLPFLEQLLNQVKDLPRIHDDNNNNKSTNACSPELVASSVARVDGILRSLAMEASAVNSRSLKHAFGLDIDRPIVEEIHWWTLPFSSKNSSIRSGSDRNTKKTKVIFRQIRRVPKGILVDDYVRDWLLQTTLDSKSSVLALPSSNWRLKMQLFAFHQPWFIVGGVGVAVALIYPTSQIYQRNMFSLTLRADVLAASWCLAYWLGHRKERKEAQQLWQDSQSKRTSIDDKPRSVVSESSVSPYARSIPDFSQPSVGRSEEDIIDDSSDGSAIDGEELDFIEDEIEAAENSNIGKLSSPIPRHPDNDGNSCWSEPADPSIFRVRGSNYLEDRVKIPSGPSPFKCRGVDVWITDNPERHIARHPNVLGGKVNDEDTFLVNFLLPFGNFVSYFSVPPLDQFPNKEVADVWTKFINGDQQYRDARLKLLPIVIDGPWIVKAAVGNGTAPALLGKVIPLQYFFQQPQGDKNGIYEVDVIITASTIAKGILSVVKGHTRTLTIAFALIIEASQQEELPETILCSFQVHALNLDDCPHLPACNLDDSKEQ